MYFTNDRMKENLFSRFALFCAVFVLAIALGSCSDQKEIKNGGEQEISAQNLTKTTMPVEGMTCNACVAGVKKKLRSMDGLNEVEVSLEHRQVTFAHDPAKVTPAQVQQAINEIGYKAGEPVTEGQKE